MYARGASLDTLRRRAAALDSIRAFFNARGVLEVETPSLSAAAISDPAIDSIAAHVRCLKPSSQYLQTSPEFAMKRLIAEGSGDIYQICRVYRDGELGRWHQPEFTLLEWYRVGWTEVELMDEVAHLVDAVLGVARPRQRVTYADAFKSALGVRPSDDPASVRDALEQRGIEAPSGLARNALLDLAFGTLVADTFAADALTFVTDYPAAQAALAAIKPGEPPVAARFEVFAGALELGNGFRELNDAQEQRRRFAADLAERRAAGRETAPIDEAFLDAVGRLPACAGVAVGVDRLLALNLGLSGVAETMSFAH